MTEDILLRCLSVKVLFPLFRQEVLCLSVFFFQGSSYSFVLSVVGQRLFVHPVSPPSPQGPSYSSVYQFWPKTVLLSLSLYFSQRPLVHPCFFVPLFCPSILCQRLPYSLFHPFSSLPRNFCQQLSLSTLLRKKLSYLLDFHNYCSIECP